MSKMTPQPKEQDDELDGWSFAKELESSLTFEYMAPHNRHKSIKGEVDRLMFLHNMLADKRAAERERLARIEAAKDKDGNAVMTSRLVTRDSVRQSQRKLMKERLR